jgi:hypothetical protein
MYPLLSSVIIDYDVKLTIVDFKSTLVDFKSTIVVFTSTIVDYSQLGSWWCTTTETTALVLRLTKNTIYISKYIFL